MAASSSAFWFAGISAARSPTVGGTKPSLPGCTGPGPAGRWARKQPSALRQSGRNGARKTRRAPSSSAPRLAGEGRSGRRAGSMSALCTVSPSTAPPSPGACFHDEKPRATEVLRGHEVKLVQGAFNISSKDDPHGTAGVDLVKERRTEISFRRPSVHSDRIHVVAQRYLTFPTNRQRVPNDCF